VACSVAGRSRGAARLAALLAALVLAACGGGSGDGASTGPATGTDSRLPQRTKATLVLDFVPNAVHAGIYRALAAGYYEDANVDLRVIQPTSTADTLKLIDAGRADLGLADAIDVAGQIDAGRPTQAILPIVQRPLGGVIAAQGGGVRGPRDLEGRKVGVTGVPSDTAVLETVMRGAGADPRRADVITIGFNGVQALEAGKIDAFTGYWPADGEQLRVDGTPPRVFALDDFGGPSYPGLVAFSTRRRIRDDAPLLRAILAATTRGYEDTIADPARSLRDLLAQNPALRRDAAAAQLRAYRPLFAGDAGAFGVFDERALRAFSTYLVEQDLTRAPVPPERFATSALGR
jgi:ABC-type nitrate/sulfonate/bicarbonate transport system substrate-binding protein